MDDGAGPFVAALQRWVPSNTAPIPTLVTVLVSHRCGLAAGESHIFPSPRVCRVGHNNECHKDGHDAHSHYRIHLQSVHGYLPWFDRSLPVVGRRALPFYAAFQNWMMRDAGSSGARGTNSWLVHAANSNHRAFAERHCCPHVGGRERCSP